MFNTKINNHHTTLYHRAETERLQLMSLLDASFKKNHLGSDEVTSELSHHLRELQDEVYFY